MQNSKWRCLETSLPWDNKTIWSHLITIRTQELIQQRQQCNQTLWLVRSMYTRKLSHALTDLLPHKHLIQFLKIPRNVALVIRTTKPPQFNSSNNKIQVTNHNKAPQKLLKPHSHLLSYQLISKQSHLGHLKTWFQPNHYRCPLSILNISPGKNWSTRKLRMRKWTNNSVYASKILSKTQQLRSHHKTRLTPSSSSAITLGRTTSNKS